MFYKKQASRVLNDQSKAKANDYGSMDGQKRDIQTAMQREQAKRPFNSAGSPRAIQSQAAC